jgi:hypothetical protein
MSIEESIYESFVYQIKEPPVEKTVWKKPDNNKLSICLIEFREHKWLKYILYNYSWVYGGTDVSLYIVHGTKNKEYLKNLLKDWKNVNYIEYPYENIDRKFYNDICVDVNLYKQIKTKFVLKFEIDTLIRRPIDEIFFNFSYAAPVWTGYPNDYPDNPHIKIGNKLIGNGGFSLRKVSRMIEICENHTKKTLFPEDVYITNQLKDNELPDYELCKSFGVEWVYHDNPSGTHQLWRFHKMDNIVKLIHDLPGI